MQSLQHRRMRALAMVGLSLLMAAPVAAQKPAQHPLTVALTPWLAEQRRECLEDHGGARLAPGGRFYLVGDFNGDGRPDYVLQQGSLNCLDRAGQNAWSHGNAGPNNDFLISNGASYRLVPGFLGEFGQHAVRRQGARDVLAISGGWAGGRVTQVVWAWNGREMDIIERRNEKGQLVDQEGRPLVVHPAPAPTTGGRVASPAGSDDVAIRAIVAEVHRPRCGQSNPQPAAPPMTPALRAVVKGNDVPGGHSGSWLFGCADAAYPYRITQLVIRGDVAAAQVERDSIPGRFKFVRQAGGWSLDDVGGKEQDEWYSERDTNWQAIGLKP